MSNAPTGWCCPASIRSRRPWATSNGTASSPPLRERLLAGRPTLAICLGLQLLGRASEESPGVSGLGVLDVAAARFTSDKPIPHLGWNRIEVRGAKLLAEGEVYFANSYRWTDVPDGWTAAFCTYGAERFVAAVERRGLLACQFHPELSGALGQGMLSRWLEFSSEREQAPDTQTQPC